MTPLLPLALALSMPLPQQLGGPVVEEFAPRPHGLTFVEHTIPFAGELRSVAVARFDDDLVPDLALVTWEYDGPFEFEARLIVMKGLGGGDFGLAWSELLEVQDDVHAPRAVDADGDGWTDLSCPGFLDQGALRLGDGSLVFDDDTWIPNFGGSVHDVAYADYDGDGLLDALSLVNDFSSFYVDTATNQGDGTFLGDTFIEVPVLDGHHPHLVAADLDGDGLSSDGVITSSLGLVIFGFPATSDVPTQEIAGEFGEALPIDLAGRDLADLVVVRPGENAVQVLRNQGGGLFAPAATIPTGARTSHLAGGDFDADGDLDVAVTSQSGVSLLLNDGRGALVAQDPIPVGTTPQDIAARDLDLDGDLDLVVVNAGDGTVSILLSHFAQ